MRTSGPDPLDTEWHWLPSGPAHRRPYMMKGFRQRVVCHSPFLPVGRTDELGQRPMLMCRPNSKNSSLAPATRIRRATSSRRRRTAPLALHRRSLLSLLPAPAKRLRPVRPPTSSTPEVSRYLAQTAPINHTLAHPTLLHRVRARIRPHPSSRIIAHSAVQAAQMLDSLREVPTPLADMAE